MGRDPVGVRPARSEELATVLSILDAGMLETDAAGIADRLDEGVLVAAAGDRVVGACVVEGEASPARLVAIAVRPGRRGQGIGTALVEAAGGRWGALEAEFARKARPFYVALGFEVAPIGGGRWRGVRRPGG